MSITSDNERYYYVSRKYISYDSDLRFIAHSTRKREYLTINTTCITYLIGPLCLRYK